MLLDNWTLGSLNTSALLCIITPRILQPPSLAKRRHGQIKSKTKKKKCRLFPNLRERYLPVSPHRPDAGRHSPGHTHTHGRAHTHTHSTFPQETFKMNSRGGWRDTRLMIRTAQTFPIPTHVRTHRHTRLNFNCSKYSSIASHRIFVRSQTQDRERETGAMDIMNLYKRMATRRRQRRKRKKNHFRIPR